MRLRNREKERVEVEGVVIAEWRTNRHHTQWKQAETDRVTSAGRRVLAVPSNDPTFLTRPKV
jgi:heme-degrading monooxygenase HmoA